MKRRNRSVARCLPCRRHLRRGPFWRGSSNCKVETAANLGGV